MQSVMRERMAEVPKEQSRIEKILHSKIEDDKELFFIKIKKIGSLILDKSASKRVDKPGTGAPLQDRNQQQQKRYIPSFSEG